MRPPAPVGELSLAALHLSYTKRWVIAPLYREQSVAEHTYRVMLLVFFIAGQLPPEVTVDLAVLLTRTMFHDAEERVTGDVPGPEKSKVPGYLKDVGTMDVEDCIIKVADSIETGTYWVQWGNKEAWHSHPSNNAPRRDVEKVLHYGAKVPDIISAAMVAWYHITGEYMPYRSILLEKREAAAEEGEAE